VEVPKRMMNGVPPLDGIAANVSKATATIAERTEERQLAFTAICLAAVCSWLALAWGEPAFLLGIPLLGAGFMALIWSMRRRQESAPEYVGGESDTIDERRLASAARIAQAGQGVPVGRIDLPPPAQLRAREEAVAAAAEAAEVAESIPERFEVRKTAPPYARVAVGATFVDAAEFALEFLSEHEGETVEVVRVRGTQRETLSTYSKPSDIPDERQQGMLDLYGFPVNKWQAAPQTVRRRD
jgi:hypothetical protein